MTDEVAGKKMVAGFLFRGPLVLLVQKKHPEWQRDLWNGVGGVIEPNETPPAAMRREFVEETGHAEHLEWRHFCTEVEPFGAYVYFFAAGLGEVSRPWPSANDADETLSWFHIDDLHRFRTLGNLSWLIPLARDPRPFRQPVIVDAIGDIREKATW